MTLSLENTSSPTSNLSAAAAELCSLPKDHGTALIAINALVSLLGTIGNILVCAAVLTNPKLRRGSNFLLCSLAIADLIITMICEPVFLALLGRKTFFDDCAWSIELAFALLSNLSASISVFHLAAISVDRLVAVVFPLRHKTVMNGYGWKSLLTTSWALPIAIFILVRVLPTVNIAIRLLVNLVVFILCHSVIFLSYTIILIAFFKQRKTGNQLRAPSSNATNAHASHGNESCIHPGHSDSRFHCLLVSFICRFRHTW